MPRVLPREGHHICYVCKETKPVSSFFRDASKKDGFGFRCRPCNTVVRRRRWWKDRVRLRAEHSSNPLRLLLKNAKVRAKKRGLEFNLEPEDIVIPLTCPVLGIPLRVASAGRNAFSPSMDRIDNTKGYVKGNVIVVSFRANMLKGDATIEELRLIAQFYGRLR